MNGLLAVAEAFLDRMTNPQYGNEVNDQYSMRFNQLLTEDREFADSFASLTLGPEDVSSVPTCAWPWYLQWRVERAGPPAADFLDALYDSTEDPAIRLAIVQSALSDRSDLAADRPEGEHGDGDGAAYVPLGDPDVATRPLGQSISEQRERPAIESRWLRTRAARLAFGRDRARAAAEADEIVTYLLQIGDSASLSSLRSLIRERPDLRDTLARHLADAGFDPEAAARWRAQNRLG